MIFKHKKSNMDPLEQRLDTISELTRGLGRKEFNNLMEAVKAVFEARQKLLNVKTEDEKETQPVTESEKYLEQEAKK